MREYAFSLRESRCAGSIAWQREVDLRVFRYQIETNDRAMVVCHPDLFPLSTISELPEPGEAVPFYGDFSQAYVFTFQPHGHGCRLKAEIRCPKIRNIWPDSKDLPTLELELPEPIQVEMSASRELWGGPGWAWWYDDPTKESVCNSITFAIDGEMYDRLVEWGWGRGRLETYTYQFWPLSVGCEIIVRDGRPARKNA